MKNENPGPIETCSPSEIRNLLLRILREGKALQLSYDIMKDADLDTLEKENKPILTIYQVRKINGCLNRVPRKFYQHLWMILTRSPGGIHIGKTFIPREPTITYLEK